MSHPSFPFRSLVIGDSTSEEKNKEFRSALKDGVLYMDGRFLRSMQFAQDDEIGASSEKNLSIKSNGAASRLKKYPEWYVQADIAEALGWLPPGTMVGLETDFRSTPRPQRRKATEIVAALTQTMEERGFGEQWTALQQTPVLLLSDDTRTRMYLPPDQENGAETELTFARLAEVAATSGDERLEQFQKVVDDVAAYMQAAAHAKSLDEYARALKSGDELPVVPERYVSREQAREKYIRDLETSNQPAMLGKDGGPIGSVGGSALLLHAIRAMAESYETPIETIRVESTSHVSLKGIIGSELDTSMTGTSVYSFQPWREISHKIEQGDVPYHLSDVLGTRPDTPASSPTVRQQQDKQGADTGYMPVLGREKALAGIRDTLMEAGLWNKHNAGHSADFPPFAASDRIIVIVPEATTAPYRADITGKIRESLAGRGKPAIEFMNLEESLSEENQRRLHTAAIAVIVTPDVVGQEGEDIAAINRQTRDVTRNILNAEIDSTVGTASKARTVICLVGNPDNPSAAWTLPQELLHALYTHGNIKNGHVIRFTSIQKMAEATATVCQSSGGIRPADATPVQLHEPLNVEPADCPAPLYVPLYGSAKLMSKGSVPAIIQRSMDAVIRQADVTPEGTKHEIPLNDEGLKRLGLMLGVRLPAESAKDDVLLQADYYRRLDTALALMPGCTVQKTDGEQEKPVYTITVPELEKPVVFVHGAGNHGYDSRSTDDPTRTAMGTFADASRYLAMIGEQLAFVGSEGITTEPLQRLEGRPDALNGTNVLRFAHNIQERTNATRKGDVALAFDGGVGTVQEMVDFGGTLVVIRDDIDMEHDECRHPAMQSVIDLRRQNGLPTVLLAPDIPDFAGTLAGRVLPDRTEKEPFVPAGDYNAQHPVIVFGKLFGKSNA